MRSDVHGNCPNVINNGLEYPVLFQSTPGLFPAFRKTSEYSCPKFFLRAGNNTVILENSNEHAEPLFIALIKNMICKMKCTKVL